MMKKYFSRPIVFCCFLLAHQITAQDTLSVDLVPSVIVSTDNEPLIDGQFDPTWKSLMQMEVPDWYKDAKFGIWAHWGPQCEPEAGDWYGRGMYEEGSDQYKSHLEQYGHPSAFGFKDVMNRWEAENWNADSLVSLYKRTGAQYFFAMANHHDNMDLWLSKYHEWNSVNVGPKVDVVEAWALAAKKYQLPFGLSVHASHAWTWYETANNSDKTGDYAGVPYDGTLTKEQGIGKWWEGLDPQKLYAQDHAHSRGFDSDEEVGFQWNWENGASQPDQEYCQLFYDRTMDLVKKFHPDLLYFDDTALPLWPVSDAGLKIASSFYNQNMQDHDHQLEAVLFGKILTKDQKKALVWDIERGVANDIIPDYGQTCTCIGNWHYNKAYYENDRYKSSKVIIQMLADIVSKNGNLLLSVPIKGDGTLDDKEIAILEGIGAWIDLNGEAIFGTRPWVIFGEGPASDGAELKDQGFNEGKGKAFTSEDVRFTTKGNVLYLIVLDANGTTDLAVKSLAKNSSYLQGRKIEAVNMLGNGDAVQWKQTKDGLELVFENEGVTVFKIEGIL